MITLVMYNKGRREAAELALAAGLGYYDDGDHERAWHLFAMSAQIEATAQLEEFRAYTWFDNQRVFLARNNRRMQSGDYQSTLQLSLF